MVRWPWNRGPNYEYELPRLAAQIRELKLKELAATNAYSRWPTKFVQHSLSIYVSYLVYALAIAGNKQYHLTSAFLIPFALIAGYISSTRFTRWRKNKIQTRSKLVIDKRRTLVDAYKKQVHFDKVMNLIGDESASKDPLKDAKSAKDTKTAASAGKTASSALKAFPRKVSTDQKGPGTPNNHGASVHFAEGTHGESQTPVPVYQTSWVDRILDMSIGVNENSPAYRYALICPHCHAHNGSAPYGKKAEEITYRCCACNTLVKASNEPEIDPIGDKPAASDSPKSAFPDPTARTSETSEISAPPDKLDAEHKYGARSADPKRRDSDAISFDFGLGKKAKPPMSEADDVSSNRDKPQDVKNQVRQRIS